MSSNRTSSERPDTSQDLHDFEGEDGNAFIWAVSYSDLLMLLTCFFIIFFNIDDDKIFEKERAPDSSSRQGNVAKAREAATADKISERDKGQKVASPSDHQELSPQLGLVMLKLKDLVVANAIKDSKTFFEMSKERRGTGGALAAGKGILSQGLAGRLVVDKFSNLKGVFKPSSGSGSLDGDAQGGWDKNLANRGLIIDFRDNFYDVGQFQLNEENRATLKKIIEIVKPYHNHFNLVFVGYADQLPMRNMASDKVIDSNMALSMMRAAKAVEYSLELGLDSMWVSAQGMGENMRQTRSLGLKIIER